MTSCKWGSNRHVLQGYVLAWIFLVCLNWGCSSLEPFPLFLWVKAACLFIKQAIKSASYQPAPANAAVINLACLLSLTEDYPEAYGWFTEVADTLPIFLPPPVCTSVFHSACRVQYMSLYLSYWLNEVLTLSGFSFVVLFGWDSPLICYNKMTVRPGFRFFAYRILKRYIWCGIKMARGTAVNIITFYFLHYQYLNCMFICLFFF